MRRCIKCGRYGVDGWLSVPMMEGFDQRKGKKKILRINLGIKRMLIIMIEISDHLWVMRIILGIGKVYA